VSPPKEASLFKAEHTNRRKHKNGVSVRRTGWDMNDDTCWQQITSLVAVPLPIASPGPG
jgi:hypothetical protein